MYRVVASYALQSVGGTASLATGAENLCQGVSPYLGLKPLVGRCVEDSVLVRNLSLGLPAQASPREGGLGAKAPLNLPVIGG